MGSTSVHGSVAAAVSSMLRTVPPSPSRGVPQLYAAPLPTPLSHASIDAAALSARWMTGPRSLLSSLTSSLSLMLQPTAPSSPHSSPARPPPPPLPHPIAPPLPLPLPHSVFDPYAAYTRPHLFPQSPLHAFPSSARFTLRPSSPPFASGPSSKRTSRTPSTSSSASSRHMAIASETSVDNSAFSSPRNNLSSSNLILSASQASAASTWATAFTGRGSGPSLLPVMDLTTASLSQDISAPPSPLSSACPTPSHSSPKPSAASHHARLQSRRERDDHSGSVGPPASAPATDTGESAWPLSSSPTGLLRFRVPPPLPPRPSYAPSAIVHVTDTEESEEGARTPLSPNAGDPDDLPSLSSSSSFSLSSTLPSTPTFSRYAPHRPSYSFPVLPRDDFRTADLDPRSPMPVWHPRLRMRGVAPREPFD